jgi:hypothetical protein
MHHLIQLGCWVNRQAYRKGRSKLNAINGIKEKNTSSRFSQSYRVVYVFHAGVRIVDALLGGGAHRRQEKLSHAVCNFDHLAGLDIRVSTLARVGKRRIGSACALNDNLQADSGGKLYEKAHYP